MVPANDGDDKSLRSPSKTYDGNRFQVRSIHSDDECWADSVVDVAASKTNSCYSSKGDLEEAYRDNVSVGNHSAFSQITEEILAAPGNALPWLADPGPILGSSLLLASQSYLDIYQKSNDERKAKISTNDIDDFTEEDEKGDIFDNSEYIDTLEGRLPLAEAAQMIAKDASRHSSLFDSSHIRTVRNDSYKRLICIGLSFVLIFSSSFGIRTAVNGLGGDPQLLLVCYGSFFSLHWFGGVTANPIMARIRPKWAMVLSTIGFIAYPLSMFQLSYYTTLPASIFAGYCVGLLWSVEGVYLMNTAATYALVSGEQLINVVSRFNGLIFFFVMSSQIFGNLLCSLVLGDLYSLPDILEPQSMTIFKRQNFSIDTTSAAPLIAAESFFVMIEPQNRSLNHSVENVTSPSSICGLDYYTLRQEQAVTAPHQVHVIKQYIFFGACTLLSVVASFTVIIFLRKLKVAKRPGNESIVKSLGLLFETLVDPRSLLLTPLVLEVGLMTSIIIADYNSSFISCIYGIDKIGYVMMTAFCFSAAGAFLSPTLVSAVGRVPVFLVSISTLVSSALFILLWKPVDTSLNPLAFIPPCLWALSDGILITQTNSLMAAMFRSQIVQAITMFSTFLAVGALFGNFAIGFSVFTLTVKIYVVIALQVVSAICYVTLEILLKREIL